MVPLKWIRKLSAFMLVFSLLAWSVAAISAAVFVDDETGQAISDGYAATGAGREFTPRLTAPSYANPYYYSDANIFYEYGWGMPNCTCYAWGRAYELLGEEPDLCVYSAHLWYDYNIEYGFYPYGLEPRLGAIACWKYTSGTSGHVAVVEKIEDGTITFSNSAYSGIEFYTNTAPIDDPSDGRKTWIFQGYIYIGSFTPSDVTPVSSGTDEPTDGQSYRITSDTGVNLRGGAGTSYGVVGWLACDRIVRVCDTKACGGYTWGYTHDEGLNGWFALDYAEQVQEADAPADTDDPPGLSPDDWLPGDVDEDGELTILDATRIQRVLAGIVTQTEYMRTVGDFDGDGDFTILDANRIQRYLVNVM